ncbi:MAG: hypothetical protein MK137_04105 [Rickettsiales bacterium]|nr:hypothetical protein [Rickettsiales bacterium]
MPTNNDPNEPTPPNTTLEQLIGLNDPRSLPGSHRLRMRTNTIPQPGQNDEAIRRSYKEKTKRTSFLSRASRNFVRESSTNDASSTPPHHLGYHL